MTRKAPPKTATERSQARYAKAARRLPPITLDAAHAEALDDGTAATGLGATAYVRSLILNAKQRRASKGK